MFSLPLLLIILRPGGMKLKLKRKKTLILACGLILCIGIFYAWNNILILDDFHPASEASTIVETPNSSTAEGSSGQPSLKKKDNKNQIPDQYKKGSHIHINLDEHMLYVYKKGLLIKTYPVSGGKASTPSPLGTWRIISKDTWGEGFGGAWLGFNVPWGKYGIHGTVYPWFIGKSNASKGCIRMKNKDVRELYKLVPHGTTVTIVHDNPIFRVLKSGDIGSDVKEIQKALKKLGYNYGGTDGKFGTGLKNAIQKFQKANKLWVSGKINQNTRTLIFSKLRELENAESTVPKDSKEAPGNNTNPQAPDSLKQQGS